MITRRFTDEQLTGLHVQGLSTRQVAKRLSVSPAAVSYRLRELGLKANGQWAKGRTALPKAIGQTENDRLQR